MSRGDPAIAAPAAPAAHAHDSGVGAGFWHRWRAASPALWWTGWSLLLLSVPTLVLMSIDTRQLNGIGVWVKPWKFQLSTGTFLLTLAWVMAWLPPAQQRGRAAWYVTWAAVGSAVFEVAYISWQAAWGRASHFNIATPYDATMYALMGVGAVLLTSTALVLGVLVLRSRAFGLSNLLRHATGWGLVSTFVLGTVFGAYLSSSPTGHWVGGLATDAGGFPLTGWSRTGGDLRVAHFFGIHAVHFLVFFGWLLGGGARRLVTGPDAAEPVGAGMHPRWIWAVALAYSALALATFLQALRGQPFLA